MENLNDTIANLHKVRGKILKFGRKVKGMKRKPQLYSLYIDGKRVSEHRYPFVTAVIIFKDRFFAVLESGHKAEIRPARFCVRLPRY